MAAMMAGQRGIEVTASPRAEVSAAGSLMSAGSAPTPSAQTPLLVGVSRRSGVRRGVPGAGARGLRLIGKSVSAAVQGIPAIVLGTLAVVLERIGETIAAEARRCRLALCHVVEAAARHVAGDVPAAKVARVCWRCGHRAESDRRAQNRDRRGCCFKKLFHPVCFFRVGSRPTPELGLRGSVRHRFQTILK